MSLDTLVQVTITKQNSQLNRTTFSVPLIAGYHSNFATLTKLYSAVSGLKDMVTDGFATTDPTYKAAAALLAQNPQITTFKIGKRTLPYTQVWKVIVKTAANSTKYTITLDGQAAEFTSDATATKPEITAGLKLALDALALAVTVTDDLADTLTITADVAGAFHSVSVNDPIDGRQMWVENTTPDPGIATDLAAIQAFDPDWYGLLLDSNSPAEVLAAAAWVETQVKLFGATVSDTEILDSATTTDVMSTAKASAYARTYLSYHDDEISYLAAGQMGERFPKNPGAGTWHGKTIAGVTAIALSAAEQAQITAKKGNYYTPISGRNVLINGWTPSGEYIDITRGVDWHRITIQEDAFLAIVAAEKVPYTDDGATVIEGVIRKNQRLAIERDVLAASPEPTVTVPLVASQSVADRGNRYFPDIRFGGTVSGAIHTVKIDGYLSV
jgi:hypothetical protein